MQNEVNNLPKKFNDAEKEYIKKRLKEEAMKCLSTYGVKKTTVDELVKRVNIPKGTFYLFYESKELLLFDAINDLHNEIQKNLLKELSQFQEGITVEGMSDFLFQLYKEVNLTGLMPILINGEMDYLIRKLPERVVQEHLLYDDASMELLFSQLCPDKENIEAYSGAFRAIFLSMQYKREIGEQIFDDAMRLMIRGIVLQLLEE
jgi:AcrR family transcriptional regulator